MRANPAASLPLTAIAVLRPGGASRPTSLRAVSAALARTLVLIVLAVTGILVLLPAALGAVAIQALAAA